MEFNEKLQQLRKSRGLTQEELAGQLYVSRTAISKWESGRGLPGMDSLRAISAYFSVSFDLLLSDDAALPAVEGKEKAKKNRVRTMTWGLLDLGTALLLFLPLFGQKEGDAVRAVSLLAFSSAAPYRKMLFLFVVVAAVLLGIAELVLRGRRLSRWEAARDKLSGGIGVALVLLFVAVRQPYAAVFAFLLLGAKVILRAGCP